MTTGRHMGVGEKKTIYIESLGCSKNTVDSEIMLSLLRDKGYERVYSPGDATTIVVNTCAFIDAAKEEAVEAILACARLKPKGARLVVAGCLAQAAHRDVLADIPEVDAVVGVGDLQPLVDAVEGTSGVRDFPSSRRIGDSYREYGERRELLTPAGYAYLRIADGCSRRCSFCTIPAIRGKHRSRMPSAVAAEARQLVERGVKELVIVSQDTLGYGRDLEPRADIGNLVNLLLDRTDARFIRLLYLRPGRDLLARLDMFEPQRVVRYFDVPLQHVSPPLLRAMGRGGGYVEFLRMTEKIRERFEDAVLRTSLIVGFPGESEADFDLLSRFVEEARFDHLGVFSYSPQEGTRAAALGNRVPAATARARRSRLHEIQSAISRERLSRAIGKTFEVLIEERFSGNDLYIGRSRHFAPEVDGVFLLESGTALEPGQVVEAFVTSADDYDLHGVALEGAPSPPG